MRSFSLKFRTAIKSVLCLYFFYIGFVSHGQNHEFVQPLNNQILNANVPVQVRTDNTRLVEISVNGAPFDLMTGNSTNPIWTYSASLNPGVNTISTKILDDQNE